MQKGWEGGSQPPKSCYLVGAWGLHGLVHYQAGITRVAMSVGQPLVSTSAASHRLGPNWMLLICPVELPSADLQVFGQIWLTSVSHAKCQWHISCFPLAPVKSQANCGGRVWNHCDKEERDAWEFKLAKKQGLLQYQGFGGDILCQYVWFLFFASVKSIQFIGSPVQNAPKPFSSLTHLTSSVNKDNTWCCLILNHTIVPPVLTIQTGSQGCQLPGGA